MRWVRDYIRQTLHKDKHLVYAKSYADNPLQVEFLKEYNRKNREIHKIMRVADTGFNSLERLNNYTLAKQMFKAWSKKAVLVRNQAIKEKIPPSELRIRLKEI